MRTKTLSRLWAQAALFQIRPRLQPGLKSPGTLLAALHLAAPCRASCASQVRGTTKQPYVIWTPGWRAKLVLSLLINC